MISVQAGVDDVVVFASPEGASDPVATIVWSGGTLTVPVSINGAVAYVALPGTTTVGWPATSGALTVAAMVDGARVTIASDDITVSRVVQERKDLVNNAMTAFDNNKTYLAIASPTTAQAVSQVRALTQQMNGIIQLLSDHLNPT